MNICVVGVGYIGLPTAAILANHNHNVIGFDTNTDYINSINNRNFSTKEKELQNLIYKGIDTNNLSLSDTIKASDVFIICVPTPLDKDLKADLTLLLEALESVLSVVKRENLIIIESTIPPGTIDNLIKPRIEKHGFIIGKDIYLSYCPEMVLPNNIIYELVNNPRIIGGCTLDCSIRTKSLYETFIKGNIYIDNPKVVELVKLAENASRDVNIAFINELALLCSNLDVDPYKVIEFANMHPRVKLLNPGIGVGGHCLPVDSLFIVEKSIEYSKMIQTSREINDKMPMIITTQILSLINDIIDPIVTIWGISYKENSGDIRNSPALEISRILDSNSIKVRIYDPYVYDQNIEYGMNTLMDSDLLLILVKHDDFIHFDFNDIIPLMRNPRVFDAVNIIKVASLNQSIKIYRLFN